MDGETVKHDTILERTKRHPQVPRLGGSWSNMISRVRLTNPFAFRCQNWSRRPGGMTHWCRTLSPSIFLNSSQIYSSLKHAFSFRIAINVSFLFSWTQSNVSMNLLAWSKNPHPQKIGVISKLWSMVKITADHHLRKHVGIAHHCPNMAGTDLPMQLVWVLTIPQTISLSWMDQLDPMPHPSGCRLQSVQPTYHWKRAPWPWPCRQSPEHPGKNITEAGWQQFVPVTFLHKRRHIYINRELTFSTIGFDGYWAGETNLPSHLAHFRTAGISAAIKEMEAFTRAWKIVVSTYLHKKQHCPNMPQLWPIHSC